MRILSAASLLAAAAVCATSASSAAVTQTATDTRPRLLVVLVVDQLRTDYMERYGAAWTGGLKRLKTEGAWFKEAAYPYLNTVTCTGHATIGTGRYPRSHGLVLNGWFDRSLGRTVLCTSAPEESTVSVSGTAPGGESASRLRGETLAQRIKAAGGRVVTVSLKPRSAIGLAGPASDATIWFGGSGTFVTSTAYTKELPSFVASTLAAEPIERARTVPWVKLLSNDRYQGADDAPGEQPPAGWTAVFPHPLDHQRFLNLWQHTPSADAYLARLAAAAVDGYNLGGDDGVDYLGVSFSTLDIVGHAFGPDSHEVQDILAHLDGTIGALLSALDERVGRGRYVVALTADHGVAPIPEQAIAAGLPAGRVDGNAVVAAAEAALVRQMGKGPHTAGLLYTDYYLLPGVWERLRKDREALAAVKTALLAVPGVGWVFTADELRRVDDRDPAQRAAALSWFEGRSGDLIVIPKQYWISSSAATTHGTMHPYDQRVPVIFYGAGIPPGVRSGSASPADLAPTLAALGGVHLKESDGRVLPLAAAGAIGPPD